MTRNLSCFCANCQSQDWNLCVNKIHIPAWSLVKIRVIQQQMMQSLEEEDNLQFGGDPDILTEELQIGQNFAVLAEEGNDEEVQYYILQCQRAKFVVREDFDCVWGNKFEVGDHAIEGIYYQRCGRGLHNYVYLTGSHPAYIHSHLVKAKNFSILPHDHRVQGQDPTNKLSEEHHA
jgi:hypothetical protein